jgi:RNA polymerase sigma factor (sigma-70 family)
VTRRRSDESREIEDWVKRAASGDRDAQDILLRRYWPSIMQAVRARRSRLGPRNAGRDDTRDLQQSAAIRVLQELGHHRWQGRSAFAAWVKKLASTEVLDRFRHNRAQKRDVAVEVPEATDSLTSASSAADEQLDDRRRLAELLERLRALKEEYGAAFLMFHFGYTHAQIGDALGCSAEAARKLVSRARAALERA